MVKKLVKENFDRVNGALYMAVVFVSRGHQSTRRKPVASHCQTLSHNVVSSTPCHEQYSNSQL